jgi:phosphoribosylformylglycinamidine synthase subunit PurL
VDVDLPAASDVQPEGVMATLFGESASRVVVSVRPAERATLMQLAAEAGVPAQVIGRTGGSSLSIRVAGAPAIDCSIVEAEQVWNGAIERHFLRATA